MSSVFDDVWRRQYDDFEVGVCEQCARPVMREDAAVKAVPEYKDMWVVCRKCAMLVTSDDPRVYIDPELLKQCIEGSKAK